MNLALWALLALPFGLMAQDEYEWCEEYQGYAATVRYFKATNRYLDHIPYKALSVIAEEAQARSLFGAKERKLLAADVAHARKNKTVEAGVQKIMKRLKGATGVEVKDLGDAIRTCAIHKMIPNAFVCVTVDLKSLSVAELDSNGTVREGLDPVDLVYIAKLDTHTRRAVGYHRTVVLREEADKKGTMRDFPVDLKSTLGEYVKKEVDSACASLKVAAKTQHEEEEGNSREDKDSGTQSGPDGLDTAWGMGSSSEQ